MKKLNHILCRGAVAVMLCSLLASCDSIMGVDSDYLETKDNTMGNEGDTLYSVLGILSQMQQLADPYMVLGEARADLLSETGSASEWIKQVCNHQQTPDNPYISVKPYYAVINNCNYLISAIGADSTSNERQNDRAAAIAIRAWTYFQLAIHYGKVIYLETPLVSVDDMALVKDAPVYDRIELANLLLRQLTKIADLPKPQYGKIGSYDAAYYFPDVRFLQGELCLWRGDFMGAAANYKKIIENTQNTANYKLDARLSGTTWLGYINSVNPTETIWKMFFDATNGNSNSMYDLFASANHALQPSVCAIKNWEGQKQVDGTLGDRRASSWAQSRGSDPMVSKVWSSRFDNPDLCLYRAALAHLRYAEAINRMNKPTMALCALNYGLNKTNIAQYVNTNEISTSPVFNFDNTMYDNCLGVRGRAFANALTIPQLLTIQDSVDYVENLILKECALETAFEGNRWGDCIRIALRKQNPGKYLGDIVAAKYESAGNYAGAARIRNVLAEEQNWYLPLPKAE